MNTARTHDIIKRFNPGKRAFLSALLVSLAFLFCSAQSSFWRFPITSDAGPGGSIDPEGLTYVWRGSSITFDIDPDKGFDIADVVVDGRSQGDLSSYTFRNVVDAHTISAYFTPEPYYIEASAGDGGSISPSGDVPVPYGEDQTFTITADFGYEIKEVKVDGKKKGDISTYTFSNVTKDHEISATFELKEYIIEATAGDKGKIDPDGDVKVDHGDDQSFTIKADKGHDILNVLVDGVSQGAISSYTFTNVQSDHTISATFAKKTKTISASAGEGGEISPSGEVVVEEGKDQTFTITADQGYDIDDVLVDGESLGAISSYTFQDVKSDHRISATFAKKTKTISASAGEGGEISPSGEVVVEEGKDQTFTITAGQGYDIADVLVDGESLGAISSYTFLDVKSDHRISATFTKKTKTISASAGEGGEISPSGEVVVEEGKDQTFTIKADKGHDILNVLVDGVSQGAISSYTFSNVQSDHTISATFKLKVFTITPTAGAHGRIAPSEAQVVNYGSDLEFTMIPDAGYGVEDVLVDGESVGKLSSYTFANIASDHSISVTFKKVVRVQEVSIPNVSMKIGDLVITTLTVSNDVGIPYTLISGSVGGYPLEGFERATANTYQAYFIINEGGNSYRASQDIPVSELVISNGEIQSVPYNLPIEQKGDLLDAENPVISSMEVEGGLKKIGDVLVLNIRADGNNYQADPLSSINGVALSAPNVSFSESGKGIYTLNYTVQEGDTDVFPGINELEASVVLIKPSGNVGLPYSELSSGSPLTIDAHAPKVERLEAPSLEVGIGGTVKLTITADGSGYTPGNQSMVNGVPLSSPRLIFTELLGGLYEISYTVAVEDAPVSPGSLELSLVLADQAGNVSEAYENLEPNQLEIYTDLPVAAFAESPELCEGDEAEITILLSGRSPWSFVLNDGVSNTFFTEISTASYQILLSPVQTTTYQISSVTDVNGVENTDRESVELIVNEKTDVEIVNLAAGYSVVSAPVKLEASVPGGTFTGPGVISLSGMFYPDIADTIDSPHTLYYELTDTHGCKSFTSKIVHVLGSEAAILIPASTICGNENPFTASVLNVLGRDGNFRLLNSDSQVVDGLTDFGDNTASIDPSLLSQEDYTIEFQYFDVETHILRKSFAVETVSQPLILNLSDTTTYCQSLAPFELRSNMENVLFEGPGVSGNINEGFTFNPREAEPGAVSIICTAFSENGCTESSLQSILVDVAPEVNFGISTACIPEGGELVSFTNLSLGKAFVETWSWNFDDPGSGQDSTSTLSDPSHFYQEVGPRSISLTATTQGGCTDSYVLDSIIDGKPMADFSWISDCFIPGSEVKFVNRTDYGLALLDTSIWTFRSSGGDVLGQSGSNSPTDTVAFPFTEASSYLVDMYTATRGACFNEITKEIVLKPTIQLNSEGYTESFDASEGLWVIRSDDQQASWVWDEPDFNGYSGEPGNKAWFTRLPIGQAGYNENSWIQSPCYDMRGVDRPLIQMDIMRSLVPYLDGAVLQYRDPLEGGWKTIGANTPGIGWYNASNIMNLPGGSSVGWGLTEFNPDRDWVTAVHDLDQVAGESNVVFRVAIASSGNQGLNNQGFAFDNVRIKERTKLAVIEHFTDNTDGRSRQADDELDALVKKHSKDVIDLQYHMSTHGMDPMNRNNPDPSSTRSFNYGVPNVPYTILDGGQTPQYRYDLSNPEVGPLEDHLRLRTLELPEFEIDLSVDWLRNSMEVQTTVRCVTDRFEDYIQLYLVVFETSVTAYTGSNGDTHFRNVVLDMLPTPAGKLLGKDWRKGKSDTRSNIWIYKSYVEDIEELAVVAFVQDRATGQILQAAMDHKDETVGFLNPEINAQGLHIYPNPVHSTLYVNLGDKTSLSGRIELLDVNGKLVHAEQLPAGYQVIQLNVEHLSKGIYILRWSESGQIRGVSKLVKTR